MTRGSLARRTSSGTNATPAYELIAPPQKGCYVREILVTLAAATASTYGLGRPAAIGIGPTTPVAVLSEEGGQAEEYQTTTAVAWGTTAPTAPVQFFRRVSFPNVISSSILWVFEHGLYIPAAGTIVLWNLASNGVVDVTAVVDE